MSEFHDSELRQQLGHVSGPFPDDNAAFAMWQQRIRQARRRRAVALTTGAVLSLIIGTVAVSALSNPRRHTLVPERSADSSLEVRLSTTSTEHSSTTESTQPDTSVTTAAPETTPIIEAVETSMVEVTVPDAAAGGDGSTGGPSPTKPHGGTQPGSSTAPAAGTQTFSSAGGSITVRRDGDRLTIVAANPSAGFEANRGDRSGDRVQVRFTSNDREVEITVRLVNGTMQPNISDQARTHDSSVPEGTDGDHSGGGGSNGGD